MFQINRFGFLGCGDFERRCACRPQNPEIYSGGEFPAQRDARDLDKLVQGGGQQVQRDGDNQKTEIELACFRKLWEPGSGQQTGQHSLAVFASLFTLCVLASLAASHVQG